jgi:DNA mismatch repair protein MutL
MKRIQCLSSQVANQIAAGEVIERPASILKELLENSLDAGATDITIQLHGAGIRSIQITDNGCGIIKEDLPLALRCHATSKICDFEDLNQLTTFGFRGEALASIAAVSHLTVTSRPANQTEAWQVTVEGRDQSPQQVPAAHPVGTTVLVEELFCQTPVRRKFLKSPKTELFHAEDVIKRLALAHPKVSFKYLHQGKMIFQLLPGEEIITYRKRISKCFGQLWAKNAQFFQENATDLQLKAWLAPPSFSKRYAHWQYFYVNGRIVKDAKMTHLIRSAFAEELSLGLSPCYVIFLELPCDEVDVNVHPTKQEVRFHDGQWVSDFILQAIQRSQQSLQNQHSALTQTSTVSFRKQEFPARSAALQHAVSMRTHAMDTSIDTDCQIIFQHELQYIWINYKNKLFCVNVLSALRAWWIRTVQSGSAQAYQQVYLLPKTLLLSLDWSRHTDTLKRFGFQLRIDSNGTQLQCLPALFSEQVSENFFETLHQYLNQGIESALRWMSDQLTEQDFFKLPKSLQVKIMSDMCQTSGTGIVEVNEQHLMQLFESERELVE